MGGLKRKIPMKKVEKKDSRAVAFSKRRKGLYSKASELCLLSDAQIAIIATPVSSNSNVSFFTFGHSSVDGVVASFLANQHPREDLGLGFWWEDESLAKSEDPEQLRGAINSMSTMLNSLKQLRLDAVQYRRDCEDVKMKGVSHGTHQKQTLNLQSSSSSICIQDNLPENFEGFNKNSEEQLLAIYENSNNNNALLGNLDGGNQELHLDQNFDFVTKSEALTMNLEMDDVSMVTTNQNLFSDSQVVEDGELVIYKDLDEDVLHLSDLEDDQILAISDSNNKSNNKASHENVGGCSQELDYDHQITDYEGLSKNMKVNDVSLTTTHQNPSSDSETVEDRGLVIHRDLYDDNLHLSDLDEHEILAISDNNNNNVFPGNLDDDFNEELDLDQLIDFETDYESLLMNLEMDGVSMVTTNNQLLCSDSKAVEDERLAINRNMNEDNLHFSDFFNDLSSVAL